MRKTAAPILVLLGLAGCGGTSSSSTTRSATPASPAQAAQAPTGAARGSGSLTVAEAEFRLTPAAPTVTGGPVQITVKNAGMAVHALEIENAGPAGKDLRSPDIQPGSSATVAATLEPGRTYQWYCPIDGHKGLGMKGTITVKANGATTAPPSQTVSPSQGTGSRSTY
jgi:uncharacterized cupredoxin-like copper-binding protein